MIRAASLTFFAALASCAAPAPLEIVSFVERDRRFAAPAAGDGLDIAQRLLTRDEIGLGEALGLAELLNPDLAVERKDVDLATAALWEAGLHPNPSLAVEAEDYHTEDGTSIGRMKRTVGLRIPLAIGGRIGAATSQADLEREVAALRYLGRRRDILTAVRRSFVTLLAARRGLGLARETRDLAKALYDAADERYRAHAAPEMDVLRASVTLARADLDIRGAERDLAVAARQLQSSIGLPDLPAEKFAGALAERYAIPALEALQGQVLATHPRVEASRRSEQAAEAGRESARARRIPDLGLEFKVGRDGDDRTVIEGGIEIPLPLFNRNQAEVSAADLRAERAVLATKSLENDLLLKFTEAWRTLRAAEDRVTVYRDEILPKAAQAVTQTDEGYRLGKFAYLDVLEARRTLADSRIAHLAALADLNLAAADLDALTGSKLETLK